MDSIGESSIEDIPDTQLEYYCVKIPALMYRAGVKLEEFGLMADISSSQKRQEYNEAMLKVSGTVQEKKARVEQLIEDKALVEVIYKRTTTLDVVANFQKKYPDKYSVYLDAENTIDKEWGETLGVDWSKVILIQPESEYGEELLDMLLDYIRSGKIGLAVLDSAPFIVPKAVQEKGLDEKSYGGNSALMKAFCDKAVPLCKKAECTFLMINQLRENIGNMYKPWEPEGSRKGGSYGSNEYEMCIRCSK